MVLSLGPDGYWRLLPQGLRVVAEAGWISVVYAALVVASERGRPQLGPIEFILLVGMGVLVVSAARRLPGTGPLLLIGATLAGGVAGWLAAPAVREALLADPLTALATHPSGWLAALAVVRGAMITIGAGAGFGAGAGLGAGVARQSETLLFWALPGLALVWAIVVTVAPSGLQTIFAASALWGTIALVAAGLVALGLSRIEMLKPGIRDVHTRRNLRLIVLAAGLAVVPVALPLGLLSGLPVAEIFGPIVGPIRLVIGLLAVVVAFVAALLVALLRAIGNPAPGLVDEVQRISNPNQVHNAVESPVAAALIGLALLVLVLVVLLVVIYGLASWLLGRRADDEEDELLASGGLERSIVVPPSVARPAAASPSRPGRRSAPADAVGAYVHALLELDRHPDFARASSETPAQHSARVRAATMPASPELARLAADYQLVRYGDRALTALEDRRALRRFEHLRRLLRRRD